MILPAMRVGTDQPGLVPLVQCTLRCRSVSLVRPGVLLFFLRLPIALCSVANCQDAYGA
jgi:hypothetical protein